MRDHLDGIAGPSHVVEILRPLFLVLLMGWKTLVLCDWSLRLDGKPRSFVPGPSHGMESLGPLCLVLSMGWKA